MILALPLAAALASGCVAVDGDRILGADLARADAAFAPLAADAVIGFSPRPGAVRTFAAGELARVAAKFGLAASPRQGACFERAAEPIDRGRLLAAMAKTLANPDARVEIIEFSQYRAPRGQVEFPLEGLSAPPLVGPARGIARWRGFVRDGEGRKTSLWARVRITAPLDQVIAVEALKQGAPIGPAQVRLEKRDAFPLRPSWLASVDAALGCRPRRSIPAGAVLETALLELPHDVERGATVETEVHSGSVVLKLEAVAETPGRRGDNVIVKNPSSGKKFSARVEGKNKVVVRGS